LICVLVKILFANAIPELVDRPRVEKHCPEDGLFGIERVGRDLQKIL
jgi:hypothetical protein